MTSSVFFQERQLNTLNATIEQFCAKEESLKSEVGSDLVSQLSIDEQRTVDQLNDTIERITQELKEIIRKRVEVSRACSPNRTQVFVCGLVRRH